MKMERDASYFRWLYHYSSDLYHAARMINNPVMKKEVIQDIQNRMVERFDFPETFAEVDEYRKEYPEAIDLYEQTVLHISYLTVEQDGEGNE